jgi:uncharacterized protein YbjT (DUF2867 family)
MILVAGATGALGSEICRRLVERGRHVRALTRASSDPARVAALRAIGADVVQGDLKNHPSLAAACEGVDAVISTVSMIATGKEGDSFQTVDEQGQLALVRAAAQAGARHFVYVSFNVDATPESPLVQAKRAVQLALKGSGMTYTILQPSFFMEAWLGPRLGFDYQGGKAQLLGSGDQRISYVSAGDVAEYAVRALDAPSARNATIRFGGAPISPREAVRIFEEESGRRFDVQEVPQAALEAQWAGANDPMQRTFASLMLMCAHGDEVPMDGIPADFPRELTSVRDYARRVLAG